jgi:hypothetical protein
MNNSLLESLALSKFAISEKKSIGIHAESKKKELEIK